MTILHYIRNKDNTNLKPQNTKCISVYKTVIQCLTYQLKPNSMDSFNFWHGHMYLLLDFELQLLSFSCWLLLKISLTNELLLESPFLWLLFLLQFCLQLSELFSTAFNSREKKTVKLLFITLLHFGLHFHMPSMKPKYL